MLISDIMNVIVTSNKSHFRYLEITLPIVDIRNTFSDIRNEHCH